MDPRAVDARPVRPSRGRVHDRMVAAAYELFSRRGIRDVGVDELITASGVARATFYRHFRSKDELVLAYLERRYEERTAAVEAAVEAAVRRNDAGTAALLAVFDVFEGWFRRDAPEVGGLLQVLIEMRPPHPLGQASAGYLARTRARLAELASAAGLRDPEELAWSCYLLIEGSIIAYLEGDPDAAGHARHAAALLIRQHGGGIA